MIALMGRYFGILPSVLLGFADRTVARSVDIAATVCLSLREARIRQEEYLNLLTIMTGAAPDADSLDTLDRMRERTPPGSRKIPDRHKSITVGGRPLGTEEVW